MNNSVDLAFFFLLFMELILAFTTKSFILGSQNKGKDLDGFL